MMAQSKTDSDSSVDYTHCPIPKTHRRLVEAHLLWHQTSAQYQYPEAFRANLNATIQALRNVTFVLQSEKDLFSNFDAWYAPWQERLKADPVLQWVKDARNKVVKQGDLETSSKAVVKLITWRDHVLAELSVPPELPPALILRNLPLVKFVSNAHVPAGDLKSAALIIERQWSVNDLEGREILEALAHAYGLLGNLVLDAHSYLQEFACIPSNGDNAHFSSMHHRTGTLACMVLGIADRTHTFELSTRQELEPVSWSPRDGPKPEAVVARYGVETLAQVAKWQEADPVLLAERVLFMAKRMLRKDKSHIRIIFIRDGKGIWHPIMLNASNRTEKHLLIRMVARFIESVGGDALIDVGEVWTLNLRENASYLNIDNLQEAPGRGEALDVTVATREGILKTYQTPFTRGRFGGIKLGETVQLTKYQPYYLQPVFEVWGRQGTVVLPDGKRIRRIWEPDPLDTCFCGGPKRFGECCKRLLDALSKPADIGKEINSAITTRDFVRAEVLARAALAQYVIWVRQHTSPTMHVARDLHRLFVELDVPALDAHVRQLCEVLTTNGHSDSCLPQLRHLSKAVGVPELSVRVTALATELLIDLGDRGGAVKEIESLGDLERVNDTLALLLATEITDLPAHKKREYLTRAVAGAFSIGDELFAELRLVRHLLGGGEQDEAIRRLDSVIAKSSGKNSERGALADALSLRWKITENEEDFRAAKGELETFVDSEHRRQLAVLLMEHGDFDEVEAVLAGALNTADPVGQLITIDARLRGGQINAAHELLLSIKSDSLAARLQYPYAVAFTHVALCCDDAELKKLAAANLRQLPLSGSQMTGHVNDLLEALTDDSITPRDSIVARFRQLFTRTP
jgi:hypothetical protein